jgi:hypothetical protein
LEEYKKQIPTKVETKQQTLKTFSLGDYRKMNKKSSEETKPPTKEENPKTKIQGWKDDDDEQIIKISTKLVNPTLKQKENLVNLDNKEDEEDLENMFEEVEKVEEIKEKQKSKPQDKIIFSAENKGFVSLDMYRNNFPSVQKDEPLEELDWDDEPKEDVKASEETKLPTKEKPKFNLQCWKDDDDEQIIKIPTSKLLNPILEQKKEDEPEETKSEETKKNEEELENMFEEIVKPSSKSKN